MFKAHLEQTVRMIPFALLLAVTAQVEVYAVHATGREGAAAIEAACPSKKGCFDASVGYAYLMLSQGFLAQDFSTFTEPPPGWWPASRAEVWNSSLAHCANLVGPPPWKEKAAMANACAQRLSSFLWNTWLTELKATKVIIVDVSKDAAKKTTHLHTEGYSFPVSEAVVGVADVPDDAVVARVRELTTAARELKGPRKPFVLVTEFIAPTNGVSPFSGEPVVKSAVAGVKSCDAAPASLLVKANGPVADSVMARWAASQPGKGPVQTCTLSETAHDESFGGSTMTVVGVVLTCDKRSVSTEIGKASAARAPVDAVSERLVKSLAQKFCP